MRLHVAVRHGAGDRHAVALAGGDVAGGVHAGDVEGADPLGGGVEAVHATHAEVDHRAARRRRHHARRLRRQHALEMHLVHDHGLDQLRLGQRGFDLEQRLAGKGRGPFGHRPYRAAEAEGLEPTQEVVPESAEPRQDVEIGGGEAQRLEVRQRVVQAAGEDVVPGGRQRAVVEAEDGGLEQTFAQIGLRHGELIEVDRERRDRPPAPTGDGPGSALRAGARRSGMERDSME